MADLPGRPRQLVFDLPVDSRHGVEDFLVGPSNEAAYSLVEAWPAWPDAWLRLVGPEGAGKTHLAAIWAKAAHAWSVPAAEVVESNVPHLVSGGALVVEDCDRDLADEAALFHLMNAIKARGGFLLLTARQPPDRWGLRVPDLLSRLRLAPHATIEPPDDALLRAVLVKLFIDRQLVVDTAIIEMLALRMERSFAAARALVDALDRLSLERGRRVTRALAGEALAQLFPETALSPETQISPED
jgi:chromosomal replication initiation ATPase DnaA